jgi:2Fe-2S ferredoxin
MQPPTAADPAADHAAAVDFVQARLDLTFAKEASRDIARGVVDALAKPEWGAGSAGVLALATRLAGRWEVGEDAGLLSLAKAIERERAAADGRKLVSFIVHPPRGEAFECEAHEGMSLKDVAEHGEGPGAELLGEMLECACSGVMACSTCHVHVDGAWLSAAGAPSEEEEDMLDLAFDRRDSSRLGCQLVLAPQLDGLVVRLPDGANNMFDFIPFESAGRASERTEARSDGDGGAGAAPS